MTFQEFNHYLNELIQVRFKILNEDSLVSKMLSIASENLNDKSVIRFCREASSNEAIYHFKTLLVVGIESGNLKDALEWAALSKDLLLDPETSDIYLFVYWNGNKPSIEECLRIESSEDFCRKFVLHPNETKESFVERTFITKVDTPIPLDLGQDPLLSAFSVLEQEFVWFNAEEKVKWRDAFSSGSSSFELFNALINNQSESNEAS